MNPNVGPLPVTAAPPAEQPRRRRILLGQLVSNGDCLYATAVARQIKHDCPDAHLTWAISKLCRRLLDGNPHVDEVWEIPGDRRDEAVGAWDRFAAEARRRHAAGDFDEIHLTQVSPGNVHNYDGTLRSAIFKAYPRPITVPVAPVLRLSTAEVDNVARFAERHRLTDRAPVVLFECSPKSSQSTVTPESATRAARRWVAEFPSACVILSSNVAVEAGHDRIVDGSPLTFRENAELTKYCTLLVGCNSGISWVTTSEWAKPLPMIQLLSPEKEAGLYNSFVLDFERREAPTDGIIEMVGGSADDLHDCVAAVFAHGFAAARATYHAPRPQTSVVCPFIHNELARRRQFREMVIYYGRSLRLYGPGPRVLLGPVPALAKVPYWFARRGLGYLRRAAVASLGRWWAGGHAGAAATDNGGAVPPPTVAPVSGESGPRPETI